jgi:protein-S-isoprenylcysteine O-methyltransferase Ste14
MSRTAQTLWVLFKTTLFTALAPYTVGILLPRYLYLAFLPPFDGVDYGADYCPIWCFGFHVLSPFFLAIGTVVYLWCAWDFAVKGMGTPAPIDAPKKLVANGLYRFVRNPMYLGVSCLIISQAMLWTSFPILVYLVFVMSCFHLFIVFYEEPHLRRVFSEQYDDYSHNVRRWIPRRSPYRPPTT